VPPFQAHSSSFTSAEAPGAGLQARSSNKQPVPAGSNPARDWAGPADLLLQHPPCGTHVAAGRNRTLTRVDYHGSTGHLVLKWHLALLVPAVVSLQFGD